MRSGEVCERDFFRAPQFFYTSSSFGRRSLPTPRVTPPDPRGRARSYSSAIPPAVTRPLVPRSHDPGNVIPLFAGFNPAATPVRVSTPEQDTPFVPSNPFDDIYFPDDVVLVPVLEPTPQRPVSADHAEFFLIDDPGRPLSELPFYPQSSSSSATRAATPIPALATPDSSRPISPTDIQESHALQRAIENAGLALPRADRTDPLPIPICWLPQRVRGTPSDRGDGCDAGQHSDVAL